ncbi:MAG TPA: hypothetical protein PKC21_03880 [Oligoflexia bacterium]|nr:hypothetical protein [Oligoflexia bacterium]HMR24477.1 hypothetical protein [Oligoflexia bacterium]
MKKIKKELKRNWLSYNFFWLCFLSFFFSACAKKINPYKNYSQQQCIEHARYSQKEKADLHGGLKVTALTEDHKKIQLLADFQLNSQGKMMLSVDKLGFNIALAVIDQEHMYLWQAKQQNIWQGSVEEGMQQMFGVPLKMQNIIQFFYINWKEEQVLNLKSSKKHISFQADSATHKITKKTCLLYQSEMNKDDLKIHVKKYIQLPSKKMLPKLIELNYQNKAVQLQLNQIFEQELNEKKWQNFEKKFLKLLEKKSMSIE